MNKEVFQQELEEMGIILNDQQKQQLDLYYQLLIDWNNKMNLTTITEEDEVYLKHFYDSLTLVKATDLKRNISLCDVGSGAGFPGIVLKIVFPNLRVTLIDSLNKRILYLKDIINRLELEHIEAIHTRMEDYSKHHKEKFDIITARAVGNLNELAEISINSLKIGGKLIFMKGKCDEELIELRRVAKWLNIIIEDVNKFKLPVEESRRTLISVIKTDATNPKYPRTIDKIRRNPL